MAGQDVVERHEVPEIDVVPERKCRSSQGFDDRYRLCTSNNSTPCALRQITVPILIAAMGGHYFIADSEIHYDVAASRDKDFIVIEGAVYGQTPCEPCSRVTGQFYSNATKNLYDFTARWANERFK